MESIVTHRRRGPVSVITMDDGKVNAMSPRTIAAVNAALDEAEADGSIVVLAGRPGVFCGGFDLKVLRGGGFAALGMLRGGFELSARLLAFPRPVVIACTGSAVAMGSFLVLSGDYRIGAAGDFKLQANEVAIGLTMPRAALAICRQRLAPAHFERATLLSEAYAPHDAVAAGFLDRVVAPEAVTEEAVAYAEGLAGLDPTAHARSKTRARAGTLRAIRRGLSADLRELSWLGVTRMLRGR